MKIIAALLFILFFFYSANAANAKISMAITVDDLTTHGQLPPNTTRLEITEKMLAIFKKHKVPEVYGFLNAAKLPEDPTGREQLLRWREAGYPLGNHTFSHPNLRDSTVFAFESEIDANEPILQDFAGTTDWKFFRYPYLNEGNTAEKRNAIRAYLQLKNYKIAQVTVDFEDWAWNDPYARCSARGDRKAIRWLRKTYLKNALDILERAEKVSQFVFGRSTPHVLLLHIGAFDAEMLDRLLIEYKKKGVEFIPLSEAQKDPIYTMDPGFTFSYGRELQYQVLQSRGQSIQDIGLEPYRDYPSKKLNKICL